MGTKTNLDFYNADLALAPAINGDDGGVWAPTPNPIAILGSSGLSVSGPTTVLRGGYLTCQSTTTPVISFTNGPTDFPAYSATHAGRTRLMQIPCAIAVPDIPYTWHVRREDAGLQAWAPYIDASDGLGFRPARAIVPIRAHSGSTLGKVTVNFRVPTPHATLPSAMPSFRVFRVDAQGNQAALCSTATGADMNGYVSVPKPGTPAAWYNGGAKQTLTITCDQNNTVDPSSFTYYCEIVEEQSPTGYPLQITFKKPVNLVSTVPFINDVQGTIDGYTGYLQFNYLLVAQSDPTQNGIYNFGSRAYLSQSSDFTQGMIVPVAFGTDFGGTLWQVTPTITSWVPGTLPGNVRTWVNNTSYALSQFITPTAAHKNGYYYQATSISGSGTSALLLASEPNWPTSPGATVIDNPGANQIVWTCISKIPTPLTFVSKSFGAPEGTALLAHGTIYQSLLVEFDNIPDGRWQ